MVVQLEQFEPLARQREAAHAFLSQKTVHTQERKMEMEERKGE